MGHTDFSDHQEQGTPARYAFHHRVRLSETVTIVGLPVKASRGGPRSRSDHSCQSGKVQVQVQEAHCSSPFTHEQVDNKGKGWHTMATPP